jgi:hypothetical protein
MSYEITGVGEDGENTYEWFDDPNTNVDVITNPYAGLDWTTDLPEISTTQYIADQAVKTETIGGDIIYTMADGTKYGVNPDTNAYYSLTDAQYATMNNPDKSGITRDTFASLRGTPVAPTGSSMTDKIYNQLKGAFTDSKGNINWAGLATAAAGIKAITGADKVQTGGWKGTIPMDLQAVRGKIDYTDPNRRPGSAGRQYFTDTAFANPANVAAAKTAVGEQARGILAGYAPTPAPAAKAVQSGIAAPSAPQTQKPSLNLDQYGLKAPIPSKEYLDANPRDVGIDTGEIRATDPNTPIPIKYQDPNLVKEMARGGVAQPRYLQGATDGMADKIPSSIDGKQKAALSHGEFVIPADVVSHLGNGNSDAGANKLYDMMARIRKARTGNSEQGKRINPNKFMPGGQVGYASGGIAKFAGEGSSAVVGSTGTSAGYTAIPSLGSSAEGSLSPWAGDYVSNYLSKGKALAEAPYQSYTGPLTAGPSELQTKAFTDASNLNVPTSQMGAFTPGTFDTTQADKYMNPYLSAALNPVLEEQRRQAGIDRVTNAGRFTQQGAFGGGRQAIMESEGLRNLGTLQNKTLTEGYKTAYDKAMEQFNKEQGFGLQSQIANNTYGLDAISKSASLGGTQRDIEQAGITADKTQFEEQRDQPYKMVQYQKDLLQGLPITTTSTTNNQTQLSQIAGQLQGLMGLYQSLAGLGQTKP